MGEFTFVCPYCQTSLAADESERGLQFQCPSCSSGLVVPREAATDETIDGIQDSDPKAMTQTLCANRGSVQKQVQKARQSPSHKSNQARRSSWILPTLAMVHRFRFVAYALPVVFFIWLDLSAMLVQQQNFSLSEAYKSPPAAFKKGMFTSLYGKLSGEGGTVRAGQTPQDLDALIALSFTHAQTVQSIKQAHELALSKVHQRADDLPRNIERNYYEFYSRSFSFLGDLGRAQANIMAKEEALKALEEAAPKFVEEMRQIIKDEGQQVQSADVALHFQRRGMVKAGRAALLPDSLRVEVLDVSGHYAKIKPLEGSQKGDVLFVAALSFLVR